VRHVTRFLSLSGEKRPKLVGDIGTISKGESLGSQGNYNKEVRNIQEDFSTVGEVGLLGTGASGVVDKGTG